MRTTDPRIFPERQQTIAGVQGRYHGATVGGRNYKPGTWTMQRWSASRPIDYHGEKATLRVHLRFDDQCRNGNNTFSMTCDILTRPGGRDIDGGATHDTIAEHFPELAPLAKWHLCSADGPMNYEANTVFLAGDRDHNGRRKGEPSRFEHFVRFGTSPIRHKISKGFAAWLQDPDVRLGDLEVLTIPHESDRDTFGPRFTFGGYLDRWHQCPFRSEAEALQWIEALSGPHAFIREPAAWSDGKERELDSARSAAIWPEATDEELSVDRDELRAKLAERLPKLLEDFRAAMNVCGFAWAPEEEAGSQPETR